MEKSTSVAFGLGLRPCHYQAVLEKKPKVDWFEILTEDYLIPGGDAWYYLDQIRTHWPIALHGVSLSIGSTSPINTDYLQQLKALADKIDPLWISDHVCWTGVDGLNMHDLLPLPYTEEALQHVVQRITQVQDILGQRILLENVSNYVAYTHSEMTEWEFLSAIAERADCLLLLDLNNISVNAYNQGFAVDDYLLGIPKDRVREFHVAGCKDNHPTYRIDTHDAPVSEAVWSLYAAAVSCFGPRVATLLERDDAIPPLAELVSELQRARNISAAVAASHVQTEALR